MKLVYTEGSKSGEEIKVGDTVYPRDSFAPWTVVSIVQPEDDSHGEGFALLQMVNSTKFREEEALDIFAEWKDV